MNTPELIIIVVLSILSVSGICLFVHDITSRHLNMHMMQFDPVITANISRVMNDTAKCLESEQEKNKIKLYDVEIATDYRERLDRLIEEEAIYMINNKVGEIFSASTGIRELENSEVNELYEQIVNRITHTIGDNMMEYLNMVYGSEAVIDHIKIYALSFVVNYANHTIQEIIRLK